METSTGEVTRLLQDCSDGNRDALDKLLPLVYNELRRLAHSYLSHVLWANEINTPREVAESLSGLHLPQPR